MGKMKNGEHTVLIIDDQKSIRCLLGSFLKNQYKIVGFEDGFSAMQWLSNANIPDLILLDLNMPRKNGKEALKEIKENQELRKIPVVVLTTSEAEEDIIKTYDLGVNSFITKPVSFDGLVEVVKAVGKYWFQIVKLPK